MRLAVLSLPARFHSHMLQGLSAARVGEGSFPRCFRVKLPANQVCEVLLFFLRELHELIEYGFQFVSGSIHDGGQELFNMDLVFFLNAPRPGVAPRRRWGRPSQTPNLLAKLDVPALPGLSHSRRKRAMKRFERITMDPAVMGGKPCIRGMRVTVGTVVGLVAAGRSFEEILEAYPYLETQDLRAALSYAAWRAEEVELEMAPS